MAKIVVIGAGAVGATVGYTLMVSKMVTELVFIDIDKARAEGEAMDISDGTPFTGPIKIYAGEYTDCKGAEMVIFAAGANQRPGESRLDLVERNLRVVKDVMGKLLRHWGGGVLLMVTNPVDVLTYAVHKLTGLPAGMIFGSGTVLDSARFRHLLSLHARVDTRNVHAYVVGEHGDSEVFLWSRADIAGIHIDEFCERRGVPVPDRKFIASRVRNAAAEIINRKGATYYGVSLAVRRICEAVLRDQHSVLTVTGLIDGQYGIKGTCLSLPCIIGKRGRLRVLELPLADNEESTLRHSASILQEIQKGVGL
ncbi:MAG: L-lactate dehydrogenase [Peptococcaceae bacterium]|nr:L-lactate dehydrogenase [Peptococcaceae bacterium]